MASVILCFDKSKVHFMGARDNVAILHLCWKWELFENILRNNSFIF